MRNGFVHLGRALSGLLLFSLVLPVHAITETYEVPKIISPDWFDYGYASGRLSMPPTGNGRIVDWHRRWPGHEDMFLVPAQCSESRRGLLLHCPQTGCSGGFTCRRDEYCPEDTQMVDGKCLRRVEKDCMGGGVGNPCDPATGNKHQVETDESGVLPVVRIYNSRNARDAGFGFGWSMPFGRRLQVGKETIGVERESGRTEAWRIEQGQATGDPDSPYQVEIRSEDIVLTHGDGRIEYYDLGGRLLVEETVFGQRTRFEYDEDSGRLARIIAPFGHELALAWNEDGRIAKITNPLGDDIAYEYDLAGNLVQVTYPDGSLRQYHYENPDYPHHLTGLTDERGVRFARYGYDDQGRAVLTEHAGEDAGTSPPNERYTIQYHP